MSPDLVTVAVLDNPEQAALARNLLDAAGIPCFLADAHMVGMAWHMAGAVGGIKLQVAVEDEEDARGLLDNAIHLGTPRPSDFRAAGWDLTASPPLPGTHEEEGDDDDDDNDDLVEPAPTLREKNATAALRLTIFGLIFCPLFFFAGYVIFKVIGSDERLEGKARQHAWIAGILLGMAFLLMLFILFPPRLAGG